MCIWLHISKHVYDLRTTYFYIIVQKRKTGFGGLDVFCFFSADNAKLITSFVYSVCTKGNIVRLAHKTDNKRLPLK